MSAIRDFVNKDYGMRSIKMQSPQMMSGKTLNTTALSRFLNLLITRETGLIGQKSLLKFDGRPFTPEYIIENIGGIVSHG